jgi:hypothetical protein
MNAKLQGIFVSLVLGWVANFVLAAGPSDTIEFKFSHELGKVSRMKIVIKNVGSMKMPEPMPEQKFSQVIEQEVQLTCQKINPDGTAVYEMTMPFLGMTMDAGGFKTTYRVSNQNGNAVIESGEAPKEQKQQTDKIFKLWVGLVESKFTLVVDARGKPIKLEGFAQAIEKAKKKVGSLSAMEQMVFDQVSKGFNDESMMKQIASNDALFPKQPVRIGDTWQHEEEANIPFLKIKMLSKSEYKLVGIEPFRGRNCAKIAIKTSIETINTPGNAAATLPGDSQNMFKNMKMDMKMDDSKGIAYIDYEKSEIVKLQQSSRMTIEISTKLDGGDSTKGQAAAQAHMVQKLLNSVTMELVEPNKSVTKN